MAALWNRVSFVQDVLEEAERAFRSKGFYQFGSSTSMLCKMLHAMGQGPADNYRAPKNLDEAKRCLRRVFEQFKDESPSDFEMEDEVITYLNHINLFAEMPKPKRKRYQHRH